MTVFAPDTLFDAPQAPVDFAFDERTVAVFPDMIHRSIPGYAALLQMTAAVAGSFLQDDDHVYDLGCSLGGVSLAIKRFVAAEVRITAVDLSAAMVARLGDYVAGAGVKNLSVVQGDIVEMAFLPCKLAVLQFVLQFIAPEARDGVLARIRAALAEDGALLVAEKTRPLHDAERVWHEGFKRAQGYSDLAIAQKRESLENVMKTDAAEDVEARLRRAGFSRVIPYYQGFAFRAWVAMK
ncbi:MAG: carboxy-S-adenosyl-L-methionine synthase CmoA [Cardiobacteriaceae bacterium]|nr:carboxy-S-adenosyl-L-methionine synthase CmoA [Cardiobacteriaceae bacterium]